MLKSALLLLILSLFTANIVSAQTQTYDPSKEKLIYYLKYPNTIVAKKEDADYFRVILPPDPKSKDKLFAVNEFYPSGQIKLLSYSMNYDLYLIFQGALTEYFENGNIKKIANYDRGMPIDTVVEFYPNGKLYYRAEYEKNGNMLLNEYADSTGKILANNGNGYWVKYKNDFKFITDEGKVMNGLPEGEWHGFVNDTAKYTCVYSKGLVIAGQDPNPKIFTAVEIEPSFKGGMKAFLIFVDKTLHYPDYGKENNIQGKVFLTFVVEKDGTLSDIKVLRGMSEIFDKEALRVLKLSPLWNPGLLNNRPVRVQYSIPINFEISGN